MELKFIRLLFIKDEGKSSQYPINIPIQRRIPTVNIRIWTMMENVMTVVQSLTASVRSFAGYSLSLTGNIALIFIWSCQIRLLQIRMHICSLPSLNGTVTKVFVFEAQTNTNDQCRKHITDFHVRYHPEMTQDIKAQMFDGNGNGARIYLYGQRLHNI